jgi:methylphosphotriester-DNA--protein-cysteine methyltransferase
MLIHSYIPVPPLSDFVALFWLYEGCAVPPAHARERILPDGSCELVIVLGGEGCGKPEPFANGLLVGPRSTFSVIETPGRAAVLGVHFKPGGAFPFLDMPARELHNLIVPLDELWGTRVCELREQLLAAETADAKFRILERVLLAQTRRPLVRHKAVAYALRALRVGVHARTVAAVTDEIGLSARRFIEVFSNEVGLTPKLFCRVRRFQQVLRSVERAQHVEWADVALSCGYFDQAHFIHDFHSFSGLNPTTYLAQRTEHLNHVPLSD